MYRTLAVIVLAVLLPTLRAEDCKDSADLAYSKWHNNIVADVSKKTYIPQYLDDLIEAVFKSAWIKSCESNQLLVSGEQADLENGLRLYKEALSKGTLDANETYYQWAYLFALRTIQRRQGISPTATNCRH